MSVELNDITSGYSTGLINDNFQLVEDELNNNVLRRDGLSSGEANHMEVNLDMNSNFVYNLPEPVLEHQAARLKDVQNSLSDSVDSANLISFTPYKFITAENVQGAVQQTVDAIENKEVDTATGTQLLEDALDQRWIHFSTLSDLDSAANLSIGDRVKISGRVSSGDGGANDYQIVAAGTGTDDGGSFIDLSASGLQAKGLFSGLSVTPMQYGAVGDGVTDDTSAVQAALDNHKVVSDPNKVFKLVSEVVVPEGRTLKDTHYFFAPPADGLLNMMKVEGQVVQTTTLANSAFYGDTSLDLSAAPPAEARFAIVRSDELWADDGSDQVTKACFIEIESISGNTISLKDFIEMRFLTGSNARVEFLDTVGKNVVFDNITATSNIDTGESDFTPFYFDKAVSCKVLGCKVKGFGRQGCGIVDSYDLEVNGNTFEETSRPGVGYGTAIYSACRGIRFTNNLVSTARTACTIGGNNGVTFDTVMSGNIATNLFGAAFGSKASSSGLVISNNTCKGDITSTALQDGIRPRGKNITVTGNYCIGFNRYSIIASLYGDDLAFGNKVVIANNIVEDAKDIAILVRAGGDGKVDGVVVAGNTLSFADVASASKGGIHVRSEGQPMKNVNISGNVVIDCPFHCVDVRGSGSPLSTVDNLLIAHNVLERSSSSISAGRQAVLTADTTNELVTPNVTV